MFDIFKKKKTDNVQESKTDIISKVNLRKEEVHKVCLTKKPLINLKARVGLVLDYSGSMSYYYERGVIQEVVEKIIPIAMEFDDNGSMECWLFDDSCKRLKDVTIDNLDGYVKKETRFMSMGGTNYAPVMSDVIKTYKGGTLPAYVLFITDGDNADKSRTNSVIKEASHLPIFFQFVGIGRGGFNYLQSLDDMSGRYVDNADFFMVDDPNDISYSDLLNEFPNWLEDDKVKNMIK